MSTHQIDGLTLGLVTDIDDVPRVRDIDLAIRLGYERPADVRELIARLVRNGDINDSGIIRIVRKNTGERGRPAVECWLTEEDALMVVARSETKEASRLLRAIIDVFLAFKRGFATDAATTLRLSAAVDRKSVWDVELKRELARLRRIVWDGKGAEPQPLSFAYGRVWRFILGDTRYEALKEKNPHPKEGSLHYAWLRDQKYDDVRREDLVVTLALARRCTRWSEFESDMRGHFQRTPIQLRLAR